MGFPAFRIRTKADVSSWVVTEGISRRENYIAVCYLTAWLVRGVYSEGSTEASVFES